VPKYVVFAGMYSGTLPDEGATITDLFVFLYSIRVNKRKGFGVPEPYRAFRGLKFMD